MGAEKDKFEKENSFNNALILKNKSMIAKYKQVMDNKKKEMTEKNEQIKELKEALAKKKTTMRSLNDDDGNSNNANVDLLTKRLSVLANLLQQKKAIIDKLMKGAN